MCRYVVAGSRMPGQILTNEKDSCPRLDVAAVRSRLPLRKLPFQIGKVGIGNQSNRQGRKVTASESFRIFIAYPDFVGKLLDAVADETFRVVHPVVEKCNRSLPEPLCLPDRAPFDIGLPAGSAKTPFRTGNALGKAAGVQITQMALEYRDCRTIQNIPAVHFILRGVACQYLRAPGVVADDTDSQVRNASICPQTFLKAATIRSVSRSANSFKHIG